ncbi:uncharacterized protein LOC104582112 [Brachypodium distachyon]|uniref:uncharacterized protein LOC104582112 n=1 Tax=Brachypodium distachyon TaxID=15368 RepID=UPI0005300A2D|nr:uncharacterized protein LOC104582112 [Brachypodium distachyon]|eukprot:XP_010229749.1 uncharacterized protein LOC104582112 [Brachypodium distachyon]
MDTNCKTDLVVNNLSEVFNNFIIGVKDKPIVTMIDGIRTNLMARFEAKRMGIQKAKWEIIPTYAEKLEWEKKNANNCRPTTRTSPADVPASSGTAPTTAAAPATRTSPRMAARRAATAPASTPAASMPPGAAAASMPPGAAPAARPARRFKPPRPSSNALASSAPPPAAAPTSSAPPEAAPTARPARRNAGRMPARFMENAEVGQSSRRKYTPVRGSGRGGLPKRSRIMEYFTCSRPENAKE